MPELPQPPSSPEFEKLVREALQTLSRDFGVDAAQISLTKPPHPDLVKEASVNVAAWQIVVPVEATRNAPKSRIKIEFANVPAYSTCSDIMSCPRILADAVPASRVARSDDGARPLAD